VAVYQRFPPADGLCGVVEHFWMIEAPRSAEVKREILIPNGRPTLVVALGEPGLRHDPLTGSTSPNSAVLFGITTRPYVLSQSGASSYVGAELKPWGIAALVPSLVPSDRLVDRFLPLLDWVGPGTTYQLARDLSRLEFGPARADRLGSFLAARQGPIRQLDVLGAAVGAIEEARGSLPVREVVERAGLSYSSLYRLFVGGTGIGPKQFSEIIRYFHFVGGLLDGRPDAAATLAALHGYYDQAHAARDFKRYTGVSASSFQAVQHGIAALMHAVPERSVQDER
jgi:AraC-like DNA-binding protein